MRPAGKKNTLITIQQPTIGKDSHGGRTVLPWTAVADVWAERVDLKGSEILAGGGIKPEAQVRYRIYYRSDITEQMRILDNGKTYNIIHIAQIGHREELELVGKLP